MKKVILTGLGLLLTSLLTGCISGNANINPIVEDRSAAGKDVVVNQQTGEQTAIATPVDTRQGFTVISRPVEAAAVAPRESTPIAPANRTDVSPSNPAVLALLDGAKQQQAQGQYRTAQSSLERAQRIAPRDPQVYFQLADLRRQQGQYLQAEQLALKGLTLARGQSSRERKFWILIADIRSEGGDHSGAADARAKARSY
ncbi:tetratricopeptide repeat protein [Amphritea sp. 1_MG-2023]|uniref:tetratricopeptide repeat protein n=1 Tax=Amphritea sp. 1_MG-2023 TaxID=3062670 RepID=UPI0026E3F72A|nr:tetratricopeptide repeat protein [Amphritea sp. 1_MG-2023]MDO6563898.1 tetratricopeptide repeat protein [Amphritea sp. 1_MG-2023]